MGTVDAKQAPELTFDAMIAATAQVHGLTVATRNVRDFAHFPAAVVNPFDFQE
jgi:predicted nucleic acid-binding protein